MFILHLHVFPFFKCMYNLGTVKYTILNFRVWWIFYICILIDNHLLVQAMEHFHHPDPHAPSQSVSPQEWALAYVYHHSLLILEILITGIMLFCVYFCYSTLCLWDSSVIFIAYYIYLSLPLFTKGAHVLRTFRKYVKGEEKGERDL